jgi:guanine nucleotide exchange factor VAV
VALPDSVSHSDTAEEDEDLYDCVENEEAEGDEIYEDLMRSEPAPTPVRGGPGLGGRGAGVNAGRDTRVSSCPQPKMTEYDKRCCCLREIQQTEDKYTDTLGSIQQVRQDSACLLCACARAG